MTGLGVPITNRADKGDRLIQTVDMRGIAYEFGFLLHKGVVRRRVNRVENGSHKLRALFPYQPAV